MISLSCGKNKSLNKQNYSPVQWARMEFKIKKKKITPFQGCGILRPDHYNGTS